MVNICLRDPYIDSFLTTRINLRYELWRSLCPRWLHNIKMRISWLENVLEWI